MAKEQIEMVDGKGFRILSQPTTYRKARTFLMER